MRLRLPDDVANFLAMHIRQNVRELEGSLTRIVAFANLMRSPISVEVCKDVFKTLITSTGQQVDVERIIKRCAEFFHLTVTDIKGPVRKRQLARARQAAMYLARKLTVRPGSSRRGSAMPAVDAWYLVMRDDVVR